METVSISISHRMHQAMLRHAVESDLDESSIVETALEAFLDIVEQCDPEARAVARALSLTDE